MRKVIKASDETGVPVVPFGFSRKFQLFEKEELLRRMEMGEMAEEPEAVFEPLVAEELFEEEVGEEEKEPELTAAELLEIERMEVLKEAADMAESIIALAKKEAEEIKEKAFSEGRLLGEEEGYRLGIENATVAAKKQYEEEIRMLQKVAEAQIKDIVNEKEKYFELYVDDLKNIALSIGEKIVHTSLRSSKEIIERMILVAIEKMKKLAWAKIYIGNKDTSFDVQGDAEFLRSLSRLADSVKVVMIEEELGTCIVETPEGIIDISIKTQLENIKEILNNARL